MGKRNTKGNEETLGVTDMSILLVVVGNGFLKVYICQNLLNCKVCVAFTYQQCLKKAVNKMMLPYLCVISL